MNYLVDTSIFLEILKAVATKYTKHTKTGADRGQ